MEGTGPPASCWSGGGSRARRKRRCSRRDRESRRRGGRPGEAARRGGLLPPPSSSSSSGSGSEGGPAPPAPAAPGKALRRRRPPRRRKRASASSGSREEDEDEEEEEEEDLIDGFAIASFASLEALEKDASLKTPERLEQRLKQSGKRKRGEGSGSEDGPGRAGSSEKGRGRRPGDRALRKPGKRRRKEASRHSYLETGYICDAESDPEEQASADELDQSFTVSASKGPGPGGAVNGTREAKLSVIPKVSGLERSQERSYEADRDALLVPFLSKEPPAPAAPAPPPRPPSPLAPTRAPPPGPTAPRGAPLPRAQPPGLPQPHMKVSPFASQPQPGVYTAGLDLSTGGSGRSSAHAKPLLPASAAPASAPASQLPPRPSPPSLALPPHAFPAALRPPSHHHPPLFPPSPGLPPPPPLLQVAGHPAAAAALSEPELLRPDLSSRFLAGPGGADVGAAAAIRPLAFQFHQHNHQHQHTHQHTHQHFTPFPPGVVPAPAPAPAMFEKYPGKIDGLLRHNFYATFPSAMPGIPPVLPPTVSFGSLQGAFQPKLTDPFRPTLRKSGKWCAMHVRVAYMILRHQEKLKLMQGDPHKLDFRNDLITCLPGTGAFGTLAHGPELTRPATLFTPAGAVHPGSAAHFGPPGAPPGAFLGPSAHIDPFSRPASFSALGALSNGAFGGLGNPTFNSGAVFGQKDSPGPPAYGPAHDPWSRLHRTPPSFPTAPAWPKAAGDGPDRPHDKEPEKREVPAIKDEKDRDTIFSRHPLRASPAPPKPPAALAHEEAAAGRTELGRELRYGSPAGGGASRSPYPEAQLKKEVKVKEEPELGGFEGALRAGAPFPGPLHVGHPLGALAVFDRGPAAATGHYLAPAYSSLEGWREPYPRALELPRLPRYLERELPDDYERVRLYGLAPPSPHPGLLPYPRHAALLGKAPPSASPAPPPGATAGLLSAPPPLIPAAATPTARSASPRRPPDVRDLAAAYKDRESR
ncbi:probable fibrosin-1 isoform X3 [Alligator mississippiensis]|uniref:probable fibrosin-1 isoform X3 n=1 Tax=Alligator mississippiensis TaxID=8496 RepID=UPI002877B7FF|nr:probable fibrosin-1 isoform X3 [Alligator mississippiensis]